MRQRGGWCALLGGVLLGLCAAAAMAAPAEWTRPVTPFRIAGNLYYVGSEDLAAYLIVTPQGDILINSNLESSPAQIARSMQELGFKLADVKILLISHGHFDHAAGSAKIKRLSGAKYEVMDADVSVIESGGRTDFALGGQRSMWFPATKVDRVLHDGDTVRLGGTVLTAHKTAGHTRGTTTWTVDEVEGGRTLHVAIVGGPNVLSSYRLVGNRAYAEIAQDFRRQFSVLKSLPCDVFLGAHGSYFGFKAKLKRRNAGDKQAFIDPEGYRAYVRERESAFEARLKAQEASAK